jgi:CBS domain-containing protein
MATVKDILAVKGTQVDGTHPGATVYDAAVAMNERKIGSLAVMEDDRLVGIVTERDILQRVVAQRLDATETLVGDVMTVELVCCAMHTTLEEARGAMKNRRIRHMPVVDDDFRLLGLISIGDLNAYEATSHEQTIYLMQQYIYGQT